jgi:hypothetical protein
MGTTWGGRVGTCRRGEVNGVGEGDGEYGQNTSYTCVKIEKRGLEV